MVSEVGFGTWPLCDAGWGRLATDEEALFLLHNAHDRGCNFFDTAPQFGGGRGEALVGKALKGERQGVLIAGKFGFDTQGRRDLSPASLVPSLEGSLARLQTRVLDVLLVDSPTPHEMNQAGAVFDGLEALKKEGRVRAYGVSVDDLAGLVHALERTPSQVIEVRFNLLCQEAADAFAQAKAQGVALVARNPLDSGWLGGHYTAKSTFSGLRARWSREDIRRRGALVDKLLAQVSEAGTGLAQTALQFVLAHPEIGCAVTGMRNTLQLDYDVSANSFLISPAALAAGRELYFREIKGNPLAP